MKELWTGMNNEKNKKIYTVRFKTDSRFEYRLVEDYCRKVLDGAFSIATDEVKNEEE